MTYSYHTFYFPFLWKENDDVSFKDVVAKLNDSNWNDISVAGFDKVANLAPDDYSLVANYQSVQYFTTSARQSIFGWDKDSVKCFAYELGENAEYHIKHIRRAWDDEQKQTIIKDINVWDLVLDGIKLKIYNTGIGVLSIETENHDYRTMKDVKSINEYGRRIFAPYFDENGICGLCADELGFKYISYDFISSVKPTCEVECVPKFIRELFPEGMYIKPAIDDRMFVACLVNDGEEFKKVMKYKSDDNAAKSLYEFIYIDCEGDCTCPTKSMRDELLDKSVYRRWIEYMNAGTYGGTIYGITNHSFMCVTACTYEPIIERPFLTIYNHMVSAVIAQRAAILAFDEVVSRLSGGFENKGRNMSGKKIKQLQELQEQYIAFLNQHMNIEVTNQEQGIELYEIFQKELYIANEMENLEKEIGALSAAADTRNDSRLNVFAIWISIAILILEPLIAPVVTSIGGKLMKFCCDVFDFLTQILSRL